MSAAELQALKQEVIDYLDTADEEMLRRVYEMLETEAQGEHIQYPLTPEECAEIDEFLELHANNQMEYSSWEEVKAQILSKK